MKTSHTHPSTSESPKRAGLFRAAACSFAVILAPLGVTAASAAAYKVMSGDTVKVDVFLSPENSAESKVDDSGQISLPALGRVQAAGLTVEEIETAIVDKLTKLSDNPSARVVVSVSEYRPIYVIGSVNSPGKFTYAARTSVLQATALAGGVGTPLVSRYDTGNMIDRQEKYDVAIFQLYSALARQARLLAEQKDAQSIEFPADLVAKLTAVGQQSILDREVEIFNARRTTLKNSLDTIEAQRSVILAEIESARSYAADVRDSVPPMQKELDNLEQLRDKGLTRRLEVLTVQRQVTDMKRESRTTELGISRSQRDLNDLAKQALALKSQRLGEISQGLIDAEVEISTQRARIDNQSKILPAASTAPVASGTDASQVSTIKYEVVRINADGIAATISADENTLLEPGDVLKVLSVSPATTTDTVSN
jgi:protein involved in polysaccharide export with SLBB domain